MSIVDPDGQKQKKTNNTKYKKIDNIFLQFWSPIIMIIIMIIFQSLNYLSLSFINSAGEIFYSLTWIKISK